MHRLLCLLAASLIFTAQAEVYTYLDAEGNRVFTDSPPRGNAERLELAPSNAFSAPAKRQPTAAPAPAAPPGPPAYQLLRILLPAPDSTISDNEGKLLVTINSEPALLPEHRFRLLINGQPAGEATRNAVSQLSNIDRGSHQLAVEIIDANDQTLERTPSQPFHMKRTSLEMKRQARPCRSADWGQRPECPITDKPKPPKDIPLVPLI